MILNTGYIFDDSAKEKANCDNRNYWWAYIAEILDCLGLTATRISPTELPKKLNELSILLLDDLDASFNLRQLETWVRGGGILIGCNTEGLDQIFGNQFSIIRKQERGEFSLSGYFSFRETQLTKGIFSNLHPEKPLLVSSHLRLVKSVDSFEIGTDGENSFITGRSCGNGWAFYFGFNLAQTFCVIQQGRQVDSDYDADGYWRTSDAIVIDDNEPEIAYTDELLFLLQNIVGLQTQPLVHQIPPKGRKVPDCLFYYAGDDECDAGVQVPASNFMASRGLPYHINLMPKDGNFAITPEEERQLKENGTELSLHYNFMDGFAHPGGFTEDDVKRQTELYVQRFGKIPICTNSHWCRWNGWAEPALWMRRAGIKADNSLVHRRSPPLNPTNLIGFSFGSSFPHFFWSDYRNGNERIEFLELPIIAYEVGYKFSWEDYEKNLRNDSLDIPQLRKVILLAKHCNVIMCMFYHPVYIARVPSCQRAIDALLSLIREEGLEALHLGSDELTEWWLSRSKIKIENIRFEDEKLKFRSICPYPKGFIAKIALGNLTPYELELTHKIEDRFGSRWLLIVMPSGEKDITVCLKPLKT